MTVTGGPEHTPAPNIEWHSGRLVQRLDAEGHGCGPVYMCRAPHGALVNLRTGEDHYAGLVLRGTEWRVVHGRALVDFKAD